MLCKFCVKWIMLARFNIRFRNFQIESVMIVVPYDQRVRSDPNNAPRPSWGVAMRDGKPVPSFVCECGMRGALFDHDVDHKGMVDPSVVHDVCGFDKTIQLEHWPGWDALKPIMLN